MVDRLLLIVPELECDATRELLVEQAVSEWEQVIRLDVGPTKRGQGQTARNEANRILRLADQFNAGCLIIAREICCDEKVLNTRQDLDIRRPSLALLRRKMLSNELDLRGLRWRRLLSERLARWDSKKSHVDDWLRQYQQLGHGWVGDSLLRQVDVIASDELAAAFDLPVHAKLGAKLAFTFLSEADHGSSSKRIGALLTRMHGSVADFVTALKTMSAGSRLVVCEDALWTGTELRSLLERLSSGGDLQSAAQGKRIFFRHCVVSDYGLWAGRHCVEWNKLTDSVELLLGERQRFVRVLDPTLKEQTIRDNWHLAPRAFDEWLSGQVKPLAFQNPQLWQGRQQEALEICERIGAQLVEKYVAEHNKEWGDSVRRGFAVGAGRFGSTLLFAHSVPKACLPVFWLGGPVTMGPQSLDWKPLFHDARRI